MHRFKNMFLKNYRILFQVTFLFIDTRTGVCYARFNPLNAVCDLPFNTETTKKSCCCSLGKAWGTPCISCPKIGTRNIFKICNNIKLFNENLISSKL